VKHECEVAWAAGIFEGEGCIVRKNNGRSIGLSISNTDLEILERVQRLLGGRREAFRRGRREHAERAQLRRPDRTLEARSIGTRIRTSALPSRVRGLCEEGAHRVRPRLTHADAPRSVYRVGFVEVRSALWLVVAVVGVSGCGGAHRATSTTPNRQRVAEEADESSATLQRDLERQGIHVDVVKANRVALQALKARIAKEGGKLTDTPFPPSTTRTNPPLVHLVPAPKGPHPTITITTH
jgi:hypothetical protein